MAYLAASLVAGRAAINARWPHRDKTMDGWIGDKAHQGRVSDHNPNERGAVDAIDVDMYGGSTPVHRPTIVAAALVHPAIHYVIFNRRIFNREDRFRPRAYNGINPHTDHCHWSIMQSVTAERSPAGWVLLGPPVAWRVLQLGVPVESDVNQLQAYLNGWGYSLAVDGDFGPATRAAVLAFQNTRRILADGIVGPVTRRMLVA